ncbi:LapA family protein [Rhabdaerophilum sp. SD176]|uniref:LapA family protein n=1 Tax=Rhabdaerophilum sp. SD176 TaxID=2983548 RepID=UPI0024DFEBB6|nr:LapA family protein [Rhabdaerophilum sp. SD176]
MLRLLKFLLLLPVAILLVLFGVANRQIVSLVIDPLSPPAEALRVSVPLFLFFFGTLAVGAVIGSMVTWLAQGRHRKAERQFRRERDRLQDECTRLKAQSGQATNLLPATR